jgi:hypothetical protein
VRSQSRRFLFAELEHEVGWKPFDVPLHLFDEPARLDPVQLGEVLIHHDVTVARDQDALLDRRQRHHLDPLLPAAVEHPL